MLSGVAGTLISESFLEAELLRAALEVSDQFVHKLIQWRARSSQLGPASTPLMILRRSAAPLLELLDFTPPTDVDFTERHATATVTASGVPIAVVVPAWNERLDSVWRLGVAEASRRAAAWALLCNGVSLRVLDTSRPYTPRFVEFDLLLAGDDRRSVGAIVLLSRAAALAHSGPGSLREAARASDRHAAAVCRSLRHGVLSASTDILAALLDRARPDQDVRDSFEQALTIVYRILFLLFAEARALVPLWHPVYRASYSIDALANGAERATKAAGLWDALRAIARLAHSGCTAGDLRVTPFNGRLFAPLRTPLAERRRLDDEAARRAIVALTTTAEANQAGRRRIAYRDLGVEQLGAVYETVLDYEPKVTRPERRTHSRGPARVTLAAGSGLRKTTGTFYTPQTIADYLVRRTLAPLVRDASPDRILSLRIVDPAMGSGAFLVAACHYLAAEYEHALVRDGRCHPDDIDESDRAGMRRTVAERCLYGVDVNRMAVQLARLSLWLATLAADRPLSFLDHRLQCGDSLIGAWIAQLGRNPGPHRQRAGSLPLFGDDDVATALRVALPIRFTLETIPNDTLAQVQAKERAFAAITERESLLSKWKRVANVWCTAWFDPDAVPAAAFTAVADFVMTGECTLPVRSAARAVDAAGEAATARRFFHWELEFPEVFFDGDGRRRERPGFDAVIGNPPWEMIRADTGSSDIRSSARRDLTPVVRFLRDSGTYESRAGHINRYQPFVERAVDLTRAGGRIGLVLPSGLATDAGSAPLRRKLFSRCDVDAIVGIDNHRGVFPIHRSVRFLLVTASAGARTAALSCRFGLDDPSTLDPVDERASGTPPVEVTTDLLERLSGPDLTIPAFRGARDIAIVERAAALFPPLGSADGWNAAFGRELNATDDADALRSTPPAGGCCPVLEGKHIDPFRARVEAASRWISEGDARQRLPTRSFERPRLAYRDVASTTNRQTLIAAVLPARCVSTHTLFCLRTALPRTVHYFLCGVFNSFVVNFLVRLRVTTHVTTAVVERLPIPPPGAFPRAIREIAAQARLLARRDDADVKAALNARVAQLYQLSECEFEYVLETFPLVAREERDRAMRAFVELRASG